VKNTKIHGSIFLRKLILGRLFVQYGNTQKPIIVNDLPSANFASNILTEATPNAKVLIFVRDGRDVVNHKAATLLSVGKRLQIGFSNYSKNNKLEFLKMESRKWTKMTSILLDVKKNHHESLVKIIKFEDLCENPIKKISEMFEFVGIKTNQSKLSKFTSEIRIKILSQKLKFLNKDLSQEEKDVIENIMKKSLRELKYD